MSKGVVESSFWSWRGFEARQCVTGQSLHEGFERARGPEEPMYEAVKVKP